MAACIGTLPRMVITSVSGPDWATIMTAFRDGGRRDRGCWDQVTEYITIAESRWRQQLAGLGRTLGAEMLIAFPDDDEVRLAVGGFLREAQRLLGGNEIDAAMLQVRKALETIKHTRS
jgi:hypothetical protein